MQLSVPFLWVGSPEARFECGCSGGLSSSPPGLWPEQERGSRGVRQRPPEQASVCRARRTDRRTLRNSRGSRGSALIFQALTPGSREAWLPVGPTRGTGSQAPSRNFPRPLQPHSECATLGASAPFHPEGRPGLTGRGQARGKVPGVPGPQLFRAQESAFHFPRTRATVSLTAAQVRCHRWRPTWGISPQT